MKKLILTLLVVFVVFHARAQWRLEVETGVAFQSFNEIRIPNEGGTTFDFTEDFEPSGTVVPFRIRGWFTFAERNHLIALFAPISIQYGGNAPFNIFFQNTWFDEGDFIEGLYKFNSYRLTYRRDLIKTSFWTLGLGLTAKVRDARIRLTSLSGYSDSKNDLGFVPLLNLYIAYGAPWDIDLYLEGDGWAVKQGRAFDFFLGLKIPVSEAGRLSVGYRVLDGGTDVDEVYNFTRIHFAALNIQWIF